MGALYAVLPDKLTQQLTYPQNTSHIIRFCLRIVVLFSLVLTLYKSRGQQ